jgi:hypothetical protein
MRYGCEDVTDSGKCEISFSSYINPADVSIPVSPQTRNRKGKPLRGGFYTDAKSGEPKYAFLDPLLSSDSPILAVRSGFLKFSPDRNAYIISDSLGQDLLIWELDNCLASAVGDINLNLKTDKLKISLFGRLTQQKNTGQIEVQATATFDFFFDNSLLKKIASLVNAGMRTSPASVSTAPYFMQYLRQYLSDRDFNSIDRELSSFGAYTRVPTRLNHTVVLSDLSMKWEETLNAYISKGAVDMVSLGENVVNKKLKMIISISRSRKRDVVDLYIEPDAGTWIYGNITDNVLQITSSDNMFNEYLETIKERKRKKKGFEYAPSTFRKKSMFIRSLELYDEEKEKLDTDADNKTDVETDVEAEEDEKAADDTENSDENEEETEEEEEEEEDTEEEEEEE